MYPVTIYQKTCYRCKGSFPLTDFNKDKPRKDGFSIYCRKCESTFAKEFYQRNKLKIKAKRDSNRDTIRQSDKACYKKRKEKKYLSNKKWHQKKPEKRRQYVLKARYGLALDQFNALLEKQNFRCANSKCEVELTLLTANVDHDHNCCSTIRTCGACIRGLLCASCNQGLGFFKDNTELLLGAVDYLLKSRKAKVVA